MSLLSAETPDLISHLDDLDIELLWHPSLSNITAPAHEELIDQILTGQRELDILCIEGAVIRGPAGTGMYDLHAGAPRKNLISNLAYEAKYVVAVGTCASFGGIGADTEAEATGLQFSKWEKGGFLGADFVSRCDLPVINLPGCPCHCDVVQGTLSSLVLEKPMKLADLNTPMLWYGMLIHQGCTRNEYHEYRVEDRDFGERGCLFFQHQDPGGRALLWLHAARFSTSLSVLPYTQHRGRAQGTAPRRGPRALPGVQKHGCRCSTPAAEGSKDKSMKQLQERRSNCCRK
jgi:hydrogenase small subunit